MDKLQINKLTEDTKKSMATRIITAIVLIVLAVPAILFGGWVFLSFVALALILMTHEFINAPDHKSYSLFLHLFIYITTMSFAFWIMIKNNMVNINIDNFIDSWSFESGFINQITDKDGTSMMTANIQVSTIGVVVSIFVLFFIAIIHKNFRIEDVTYLFTMSVFIGISVQAVLFLRYFPKAAFEAANGQGMNLPYNDFTASLLLFYVIIGTFITDAGAYFTGLIFGRKKMNERISPKKTWEGFIGGVVLSFAVSVAFALVCDHLNHPILPILNREHWYWIIIISLVMPFIANLGDFIFSALKRHFNIKDYGTLLRGHGGVLDRVDSLLCVSLFVAVFLIFLNNGWNFLV